MTSLPIWLSVNVYGDDPDKCVFFHCGNWAKAFLPDIEISTAPILGTTLGEQNTWGALAGRTPIGPVTFGRLSTDDRNGRIAAYVGEGSSRTTRSRHSVIAPWCACPICKD